MFNIGDRVKITDAENFNGSYLNKIGTIIYIENDSNFSYPYVVKFNFKTPYSNDCGDRDRDNLSCWFGKDELKSMLFNQSEIRDSLIKE